METLITSRPQRLEQSFVPANRVEPALLDIHKEMDVTGPGGQVLTCPIFVEGAEPGDTREVRIQDVRRTLPYADTAFGLKSGLLP